MAWVPIGVILARRRGIRVAVTIQFIFFTWLLSVWTLWRLGNPGYPSPGSYPQQRWREIGLNVFVALVWLVYDAAKYRLRPREVV
jgi:hypothetical protein